VKRVAAPADERHPAILFVDPEDGATGVFRDAPIALRTSVPLDPASVGPGSIRVHDDAGTVPGSARLIADGSLVLWTPERLLRADALHFIVADGLRDRRGRVVAPLWSRFVACAIGREDLLLPF
jgi:hypothetical protein